MPAEKLRQKLISVSDEDDDTTHIVAGTDKKERLIVALNVTNGEGAWSYGND